jgi:hypothetical protein
LFPGAAVLSNGYLARPKPARIELVIEKADQYVDVEYEGPFEGASELLEILKKVIKS